MIVGFQPRRGRWRDASGRLEQSNRAPSEDAGGDYPGTELPRRAIPNYGEGILENGRVEASRRSQNLRAESEATPDREDGYQQVAPGTRELNT